MNNFKEVYRELKSLNEDRNLSAGIFWIVDVDNISNNKDYCFTIPCDLDGNPFSLDGLNAKSKITYNHEKTWKELPPKLTHNKPFNYYPRGRVQITNSKAIVYLNPNINNDKIQKFIKDQFNLESLSAVRFVSDGSKHYQSNLDKQ